MDIFLLEQEESQNILGQTSTSIFIWNKWIKNFKDIVWFICLDSIELFDYSATLLQLGLKTRGLLFFILYLSLYVLPEFLLSFLESVWLGFYLFILKYSNVIWTIVCHAVFLLKETNK